MAMTERVLPAALVMAICAACAGAPHDGDADTPDAPLTVDYLPGLYPNESLESLELVVENGVEPLRVSVDGRAVEGWSVRRDGGVTRLVLPGASLADGERTITVADGRSQEVPLRVPVRGQGIYQWSVRSGVSEEDNVAIGGLDAAGAFVDADGLNSVITVAYSPIALFPDFSLALIRSTGSAAEPLVQFRGTRYPMDHDVFGAFLGMDVKQGPYPFTVIVRLSGAPARVYGADPREWTWEDMPLTLANGVDIDGCGVAYWHGAQGTHLLIAGYGDVYALPWPAAVQGPATLIPLNLEGPGEFCGLTTGDLDGDGNDEVVTSFYFAQPGLGLHAGNPVDGFQRILHTHEVELVNPGAYQQVKASVEDIDGDGLPDLIASNGNGGVDVVFMGADGTVELRRDLIPVTGPIAAATAARLGEEGTPYVLIGGTYQAFRIIDRSTAVDDSWRFPSYHGIHGAYRAMIVMDIDGDGLMDLGSSEHGFNMSLWRRPGVDEADGLVGPRLPRVRYAR